MFSITYKSNKIKKELKFNQIFNVVKLFYIFYCVFDWLQIYYVFEVGKSFKTILS